MNLCMDFYFVDKLSTIPFHICNVFEDVDDISWAQHQLLMSVVNEHAPLKTKFVSGNQVPYMNSELRKAINQRNMWRGKHFRDRRNKKYSVVYVKLRNKVVKLHKQSIKTYFRQRCVTQNGNKKFFKTIKPFISDKNSNGRGNKIILKEEDCILSRRFQWKYRNFLWKRLNPTMYADIITYSCPILDVGFSS